MILWSIDTLDWKTRNAQSSIDTVMNDVQDGDVILMHDIHTESIDAALVLIPKLEEAGYQLVTVSEMAKAKETASCILQDAQKDAAARSEAMLQEAKAQAAGIKAKAEADILQEKKKAVNEIKNEIGGIAMDIAGKVIEREISEDDHRKLIDEFIENVGEAS